MVLIRAKDAAKMTQKEREEKLKDLRMELVRGSVTANRANAKTKEIKRAISRLMTCQESSSRKRILEHAQETKKSASAGFSTFNKSSKEALNKK